MTEKILEHLENIAPSAMLLRKSVTINGELLQIEREQKVYLKTTRKGRKNSFEN